MAESSFLSKAMQFLSEQLHDFEWLDWRVFIIAVPVAILLFLIVWRRLKGADEKEHVPEIRDHSHIIGARLVKSKEHPVDVQGTVIENRNRKKTQEQVERLNCEIDLLKLRIARQSKTEAGLEQKVAELIVRNEQLRQETAESKQVETQLRQEIGELMSCNERLQQEASRSRDAAKHLEQQLSDLRDAKEQFHPETAESRCTEEALKMTAQLETADISRQTDGKLDESRGQVGRSSDPEKPLDIDALRTIAELIRRIQGHSAQN